MIQKNSKIFLIALMLISFVTCTNEQADQASNESLKKIELSSDELEITNAWARPGREGGGSAIYMNILNGSSVADTLISLSSPVAGMTEVHETYEQEEGMMGMRPAETVVVPARDALSLEPGGLHVMLMQLNRELTEGDSLEFTLNFTHAGQITLTAPVQTMNK
jgi:copper(I)-binding protein